MRFLENHRPTDGNSSLSSGKRPHKTSFPCPHNFLPLYPSSTSHILLNLLMGGSVAFGRPWFHSFLGCLYTMVVAFPFLKIRLQECLHHSFFQYHVVRSAGWKSKIMVLARLISLQALTFGLSSGKDGPLVPPIICPVYPAPSHFQASTHCLIRYFSYFLL